MHFNMNTWYRNGTNKSWSWLYWHWWCVTDDIYKDIKNDVEKCFETEERRRKTPLPVRKYQ